ncbi:MAG TPA: nickel pincer cofactor biosynthesis protein LarC [Planctomycetota bacterium]|nr:nickel pincer cofactor biosynthesis protein LarC [Planctomycetota bacterium]
MASAEILYIEPFSGMAGDMFLAALLALEDPRFRLADLEQLAEALLPGQVRFQTEVAWRGSLSGLMLTVVTPESDHAPHRGLSDCLGIIEGSPLSPKAREFASNVFRRIAQAEARVHGTTVEEIHFHEVGAVDALIDICGAALALDRLGIRRVVATPPLTGTGTVRCAHGEMPVPAPGTAEIMRGLPMQVGGGGGERLTPTGAALLAECVAEFRAPDLFVAERIGYAAGHRDPKEGPPNILRVQLGSQPSSERSAQAWLMEVNFDDMSGEELGHLMQVLRERGALEVWSSAVQMKKERPGSVVSALCRADRRRDLEAALFAHSTSLGLRWILCERTELEREQREVSLGGACVRVKVRLGSAAVGPLDVSPEYDDLARLSRDSGRPIRELEREAIGLALEELRRESADQPR